MKLFIDSATNYLYLAVIDGDKAYSLVEKEETITQKR